MLAVLACSASFAQLQRATQCREAVPAKGVNDLPTWSQISNPFVANDINGNPVDVQAILNSGQSIVIDYSCCWCGPCWSLHQSGILEAIDAMPDVTVIWCEIENGNTTAAIYGDPAGGQTYGDWTVDANNNPVSYPIIDNAQCLNMCASLYENAVPSVYYIAPNGYFCSVYGESWGFGSSTSHTAACAAITNLINSAPAAGQAPIVEIQGMTTAVINNPTNYSASIISVDNVTSVEWSFSNGTPATATGTNVSTTWSNTGSEMVICTVTNTTGTTSDTMYVNVIEWNWGDEMSYCGNDSYDNAIGASGNGLTWGVMYPASFMAGRNYLDNVKVYAHEAANFTLMVYQTNPNGTPANNDLLYQHTYAVSENWNTLTIYDQLQLDPSKDLWIAFECPTGYPAAASTFCGDPNGSFVNWEGAWLHVYDLSADLMLTWMIKATTSATAPALHIDINGSRNIMANEPATFTVAGPAAATYAWTIEGGNPATATGNSVTTTWTAGGTFTVTVTATLGSESATANMTVNVVSCDPINLPFTCGFEANDNLDCWSFIDQDGDGYGWDFEFGTTVSNTHSGTGSAASASYINNVGALRPDNWMITPGIVVPAEGATIEWWVVGQDANYYAEYYSVLVSTTGVNPSDFTNTVFAGTAGANWAKVSRSLAAFAGQTIHVAFRHHNISDMYWMLLDDISITAGNHAGINEVNDINVALYPNPVTSKLNISAEGVQEVSIIDVNGRTVMTQQNANAIDMSEMANGVYFVRVITNEGISTQKIVKK